MSVISKTAVKQRLSVKAQTLAAILAVIGAIAVPRLFHAVGAVSGLGTALGETFLPMHLPIILTGFLAGPFVGAAAGLLGPLTSYLLTAMPGSVMLPFMMIELCVYGLTAGMLGNVKIPCIAKVFAVQLIGRAVRAIAILASVHVFGNNGVNTGIILTSITAGLPGIILQWSIIPLLMYRIEGMTKNEQ